MIGTGKWIVESPWEKVSEKEVWEALKRMKKGKSSGPVKVTCKMLSNDVCLRELCGVANDWLIRERVCQSHRRGALLFPCTKVREMCWSVATTAQSSCWSMG